MRVFQAPPHTRNAERGFTLPEMLVASIAFIIIVAGLYAFLSSQTRSVSDTESKRRLTQRKNNLRQLLQRELDSIGINPKKTAFEIDMPPTLATDYQDCNVPFPLVDPSYSKKQICFGITDARYYKLAYTRDRLGTGTEGQVDNQEMLALILRDSDSPFTVYDPSDQAGSGGGPSYLDDIEYPTPAMYPTSTLVFPPVDLDPLPYIPKLCHLQSGSKFNARYELLRRSYDNSGNPAYSLLADRVLCLGVAYFRPYTDYEACIPCEVPNPAPTMEPLSLPVACSTKLAADKLPFEYFRGQTNGFDPLMNEDETDSGLVFMPFSAKAGALNPDEAYNVAMLKLTVIIEDDKLMPGYEDPRTGRPYKTLSVDMTYRMPPANRPCDANLGNCAFNNQQCLP